MSPSDLRERFFRLPWFRIKNGTGSVIPPCSILLISSWTTSNNNMLATVVQPNAASTDFNWDGYCISGPFSIGSGSSNEGVAVCASEPWYARYDTGTPAKGQVFGPKHGQLTLTRYYPGFHVLGHNVTVAGNNATLVRWKGIGAVLGKIDDSTVNKGSSCTVSAWLGAGGSEADSTMNITGVYNRAVNLTSISGKFCKVSLSGETPFLDWVECS